jgi:hypothetical protein
MVDAALWMLGPALIIIALVGLGDLLIPADSRLPVDRSVAAALAGLLVLMAAVPLINLFVPLGTRAGGLSVGLGLLGAALAARRGHLTRRALTDVLLVSIITAGIYRASSVVIPIRFLADTVIYHLQHMEWIAQSALPLGAAHLQTRLGLNPGFMTLASALRWEPLGQSHLFLLEIAVRTLFLLTVLGLLRSQTPRRGTTPTRTDSFALGLTLASLPFFAINKSGTDGNIGFLLLIVVLVTLAAAESSDSRDREDSAALVIALVALAATFKLSAITTALLALPLLTGSRRTRLSALLRARHSFLVVASSLAVLGWVMRSVAITGCVAFPIGATCTSLSWSVGASTASITATVVTEFARRVALTGATAPAPDVKWVAEWLPSYLTSIPALVVLASLPVALIGRARTTRSGLKWSLAMLSALPATLVALSVADLLGGRRFMGISPSLAGVVEDYPNVGLLVMLPLFGLVSVLVLAAVAPCSAEPSRHEDAGPGATGALAPFLVVAFIYWFVAAPAVRFAWAIHVVVAALLLARWIATLRLPRRLGTAVRLSRLVAVVGASAIIGALGVTRPALPIEAPETTAVTHQRLGPHGYEVSVPPDVRSCSTMFPCAPTPVLGVEVTRALGRPLMRGPTDVHSRLLLELGIVPSD